MENENDYTMDASSLDGTNQRAQALYRAPTPWKKVRFDKDGGHHNQRHDGGKINSSNNGASRKRSASHLLRKTKEATPTAQVSLNTKQIENLLREVIELRQHNIAVSERVEQLEGRLDQNEVAMEELRDQIDKKKDKKKIKSSSSGQQRYNLRFRGGARK